MATWEYLTVFISGNRVNAVNDREIKPLNVSLAVDYFNQLGIEGWELVAAPSSNVAQYTAIFKRPKS